MSLHYRNKKELHFPEFKDGRTKQAFKNDADINKLLAKAQRTGTTAHIQRYETIYGEFDNFDLQAHQDKINQAHTIFADLPSEVRREFNQSPAEFFEFVNHPDNQGRVSELLPALAQPGTYFPDVSPKTPPGALLAPTTEGEPNVPTHTPDPAVAESTAGQ